MSTVAGLKRHTAHKTCKSPPSCSNHVLYMDLSQEFLLTIILKIEVYIITVQKRFPKLTCHIVLCDSVPAQGSHSDHITGYFSLLPNVQCVRMSKRETDNLPPYSNKD
jgi:hypothetical protein